MPLNLHPPDKRRLSEMVADTLRQAIFDGTLRPGARLIETDIASELEVSRGPVREAIIHLEREGLVEQYPNRGAKVVTLNVRDAWELYTLRGRLESWAVTLAAGQETLDHRLLAQVESLLDQMKVLGDEDLEASIELDLAFHELFVERSGHEWLLRTYHGLDPMIGALFFTVNNELHASPANMFDLHQRIINPLRKGLKSGDFAELEAAVLDHWTATGERLLSAGDGD